MASSRTTLMTARRFEHGCELVALALVAGLGAAACGGGGDGAEGPDSLGDQEAYWIPVLQDLDESLLAAHVISDLGERALDNEWLVAGGTATRGLVLSYPPVESGRAAWHEMTLPAGTPRLRAIWGSSAAGTYVVGDRGTILRRNAEEWTRESIDVPPETAFHGISGTGPNDVWVVGEVRPDAGGVIVHWDGLAWSRRVDAGIEDARLYGVWALDATHAFAVGEQGTILAWEGSSWARETTDTDVRLAAIWGASSDDVFVAGGEPGGEGLVLRRRHTQTWTLEFETPSALNTIVGSEFDEWPFIVAGERGYVGAFHGAAEDFAFKRDLSIQFLRGVSFVGGIADPDSRQRFLVAAEGGAASNYWSPSNDVDRLGEPVP